MTRGIASSRRPPAATLLSLLALVAAAEARKPTTAPATKPDRNAAIAALLNTKMPNEVPIDGLAFVDAVDFLRDLTGCGFYVDWAALEAAGVDRNTPITYRGGKDLRIGGLLKDVTALAGGKTQSVTYGVGNGVIIISTPQRVDWFLANDIDVKGNRGAGPATRREWAGNPTTAPTVVGPADVRAVAAQLRRKVPEHGFDGVPFADVIEFLRDVVGINFVVDWKALEPAGIDRHTPVTYRTKSTRTSEVLKEIASILSKGDYRVTFEAAGGVVFVSTPKRVERFVAGTNALHAKITDEDSRDVLTRRLADVKFDGTRLGDAIDYLREARGTSISVDWRELEAAGIDRNAPVKIRLTDATFGQVLYVLLTGVERDRRLDFTADSGRILIHTAAVPSAATKPAK